MANILFATNNLAHMLGAAISTNVNTYDPTRVPYSLQINSGSLGTINFPKSIASEVWLHFKFVTPTVPNTSFVTVFYHILSLVDKATNKVLVKLELSDDTGIRVSYHNGTSIATGTLLPLVHITDVPVTYDIKYESSPTEIIITVYSNNAQMFRTIVPVVGTSPGQFDQVVFYPGHNYTNWSEIIVADADTRNSRLTIIKPASVGFHDDWVGALANLVDDNSLTGVSTTIADSKLTATLAAYAGDDLISNLVTVSMASSGLNAPASLQHIIRHSGVDYNSASMPVGNSVQNVLVDWQTNPGTGLPWVAADLPVTEIGFQAIT